MLASMPRPPDLGATDPADVAVHVDAVVCREIDQWLQLPAGDPEGLPVAAWPLVLMRETPFEALGVVKSGLERYRRVQWSSPVPPAFACRTTLEWVAVDGGRHELAVRTTATVDGDVLAESLVVIRQDVPAGAARGEPSVPPAPAPGRWSDGWQFMTREDELDRFSSLVGSRSPIVDSSGLAQRHGHANRLVPGLFTTYLQLYPPGRWPERGGVEAWYLRPVPVGAILRIVRAEDDPTTVGVVLPGRNRPASIARLRADS